MVKLPNVTASIIKSPARIRLERGTEREEDTIYIIPTNYNLELVDLDLPNNIKLLEINFDSMEILARLYPNEGPFQGAQVDFEVKIPEMYPHRPPKVRILQIVYIIQITKY